MLTTLALLPFSAAWGRAFSLDLRRPAQRGAGTRLLAQAPCAGEDGNVRDYSLGAGAAEIGEVAVGDRISFTLFDDVELTLSIAKRMPSRLDGEVFLAEVEGYGGMKSAVVLRTGDGLTVDVQDVQGGKTYKVISAAGGVRVVEIEPTGETKCGCDSLAPRPVAAAEENGGAKASAPRAGKVRLGVQSDTCIDILVAYDRFAAQWANANGGGITNFAQVAVAKMNTAIANTGLDARFWFRLVGVTTVSVSANDVHDALYAIDDGESGWADIKAFREVVGADIVTTMIDTGSAYGVTGVGWSLSDESSLTTFGDLAYNVCAVRSVAQTHTMTHECGHNMGAGHSTIQSAQPGPQLYDWSSGYYFTGSNGKKYCTIMAYSSDGPGGAQVPYFSSPSYSYEGVAVGDSLHDNTSTLADTYPYVANWRAQKTPMSYQVVFEPASGELFEGSLYVTLSPGMPGTPVRYTLDGSDPTMDSPLYESPILITGTTTIKASTVVDGVCSIPFKATYYSKNDLGYATGLPELTWSVSVPGTSSLGVQTDSTIDGAAIGAEVDGGDVCSFYTTVDGPASISWQRKVDGYCHFTVLVDGTEVFADSMNFWWMGGYAWELQSVDIPSGSHEVRFRLGDTYFDAGDFGMYSFDDFRLYRVQKPRILPEPKGPGATSYDFESEELMVSIVSDDGAATVYYTLDGSDPGGEGAIPYDGPFFITESTTVRAVVSEPGRGSSIVVDGVFRRLGVAKAGEWTLSGLDAYESVQRGGRMIAELLWNYPGCGWSKALARHIMDPVFLLWAELNGVYLLADSWGDRKGDDDGRFWSLYDQTDLSGELGAAYYPTFVFAAGSDVDKCLGAMLARNDGEHATNGIYYRDSAESLIECFGSFLDTAKPLDPPVASPENAYWSSFPFDVYLSNPNYAGTIYYTLDGSAPTRENGIAYTGGPITIPSPGTTLKAVVWPLGPGSVSGVPLSTTYGTFGDAIGTSGVSWTNDAVYPWTLSFDSSVPVLTAGRDTSITSGSVTSTLKAEVSGPGELSFGYYLYTWYASLSLEIGGKKVATWNRDVYASTNIVVDAEGPVEIKWTYTYPYRENPYADSSECQIGEIAWVPHVAPAAPIGATVSGDTYEYGTLLRWNESEGADEYVVYRSRSTDLSSAERIGSAGLPRYWDTTAVRGETYYYWVAASNAYGESPAAGPVACSTESFYTIDYRPGAEGVEGSMAGQVVFAGKVAKLNPCAFVHPSGRRFAGWRRVDTNRRYDDGIMVFNLAGPGAVVVMEAIWE